MIKAAIFDMDGLLIDSEPLWREAEVAVFNSIGVPVTHSMLDETHGLREDELIAYWYGKFPWHGKTTGEVEEDIKLRVLDLIKEKGEPKKGVEEILKFLKAKKIKLGIASSSYMSFIKAVVQKFNIEDYFDILYSGEGEQYGKPHPGIYLSTLLQLGVSARECIAFEDSYNGVQAAKSAYIACICIPETLQVENKKLEIADMILPSLEDFNENTWETLNK